MWPYLALFASGLCWGLGLPFGKLALAETDAAHMIMLRFAVAGLASAPILLRTRRGRRLLARPAALVAGVDRKSTRLNSSHSGESRMPSSA